MARLMVGLLVIFSLQRGAPASQAPDHGEYRLRIEGCADLTHLSISTYITGPFGGVGSFGGRGGVRDHALSLSHDGQRAESLKAIIICAGERTMVLDERR